KAGDRKLIRSQKPLPRIATRRKSENRRAEENITDRENIELEIGPGSAFFVRKNRPGP
ncbi:hypothetical protein LEP1GSC116_1021, partial [Leptospira interrogans serovar Icterohaemorrhagiae str. Verdun HP]